MEKDLKVETQWQQMPNSVITQQETIWCSVSWVKRTNLFLDCRVETRTATRLYENTSLNHAPPKVTLVHIKYVVLCDLLLLYLWLSNSHFITLIYCTNNVPWVLPVIFIYCTYCNVCPCCTIYTVHTLHSTAFSTSGWTPTAIHCLCACNVHNEKKSESNPISFCAERNWLKQITKL